MRLAEARSVLLAVCVLTGLAPVLSAQETETWQGANEIGGEHGTKIEVTFVRSFGVFAGELYMPDLTPIALPLTNVVVERRKVYFELEMGPNLAVYDGERIKDDFVKGTFTLRTSTPQDASEGTFFLELKNKSRVLTNLAEESVGFDSKTGTISGTLLTPDVWKPPIALLISRPTLSDRDGNLSAGPGLPPLKLNTLKLLAIGLSNQGIATVRFDNRGIGESRHKEFDEADLRFETYISDVLGWLHQFKADNRFSAIFLIGHQEGALLAKLAALKFPVSGVVSLAGAGVPGDEIVLEQVTNQPTMFPELASDLGQLESTLAAIKKREKLLDLPPNLIEPFRESIREYLATWFSYDPQIIASKLAVPFLIVQGTTDLRVAKVNGRKLADANPNAHLVEIQRMNHLLRQANDTTAHKSLVMSRPDTPLHDELIPVIANFVNEHGG